MDYLTVDRMSFTYLTTPEHYDISEKPFPKSPILSKRFGFLSEESQADDTDTCSEGKASGDESDVKHSKSEKQKHRKNSNYSFSNVKRKISHTFQRRNSTSVSPEMNRRKAPLKSKSTTFGHTNGHNLSPKTSPSELRRIAAINNNAAPKEMRRKGSATLMHPFVTNRKRSAMHNPFASSSNPDIKSSVRSANESLKQFNVYMLGTKSVGKTALTVRFLTGRYIHEYTSSPEEKYNRIMKYGDDYVNVTIFINDIERMEEDIELSSNAGIMIIYSIIDKSSFKEAQFLLNNLSETSITEHFPVVLIATKTDLARLRKITQKQALDLANEYNCTFFDVSSADDDNVVNCFHNVFRQIEVRKLLKGNKDDKKATILNAKKSMRSGSFRYGSL